MSDSILRGTDSVRQVEHVFGPLMVRGGSEDYVYRAGVDVAGPPGFFLRRVGTFIGVDTGDVVECHAEVLTADQVRVYGRSLHKEGSVIYDAWDWQDVPMDPTGGLRVEVLCRVTGLNFRVFTKRLNPLTAYFHSAVVLEFYR